MFERALRDQVVVGFEVLGKRSLPAHIAQGLCARNEGPSSFRVEANGDNRWWS